MTGELRARSVTGELRADRIEVFGLGLPVLEAGPERAHEAVVLLHGHPGSSRDWAALLPQVGAFARAVAFDLPGLGKADKPPTWDYSIPAFGLVVGEALRQLGVTRAHLVMHDLGGGAGLTWAVAHPDAFASAVIMATGILIDYDWHRLGRLLRRPLVGPAITRLTTERSFKRSLRSMNPGLPHEFVAQLWDDYDLATRRAMMTMYRSRRPGSFERFAPFFRALDRPALCVWGADDPFVPVEQAHNQRESFPSAEITVLDGCGHWPWVESPDGATGPILDFLRRQTGAAR